MREKRAAIADNTYQRHVTRRAQRRRPTRLKGSLTRSERRDPEKVAEAVLAHIRTEIKKEDGVAGYLNLWTTKHMGVADPVAKKALHLLNLRGLVSQAVHYGERRREGWCEDVYFIDAKAWL